MFSPCEFGCVIFEKCGPGDMYCSGTILPGVYMSVSLWTDFFQCNSITAVQDVGHDNLQVCS